ncbi:metallophosphoesterase, partial [Microvirga sp. 3-52]|nr:metallophosphoesterase [Microvirga sp. 3-52]
NFVTLDKEVEFAFTDGTNFDFQLAYYTISGVFTGSYSPWFTATTTISKMNDRKVRIVIQHKDKRTITSYHPLIQGLSVIKLKENSLKVIDERVTALEGTTITDPSNGEVSRIPSYWQNHVKEKIEVIKTHQANAGIDGTSFGFVTDMHVIENAKKSGVIMEKVLTECDVPYFFNGGDHVGGAAGVTKEQTIKELREVRSLFKAVENKCIMTIGNHDDNSITNNYDKTVFGNEMYSEVFRYITTDSKFKAGKTGQFLYADDEVSKVRYISLNSLDVPYIRNEDGTLVYRGMDTWAFRQEQLEWFGNVALNTPTDEWGVVVCSHIPINQGLIKNDSIAMSMLQAYNDKTTYTGSGQVGTDFEVNVSVDYTGKGGDAICWIAGHYHRDQYITLSSNFTFKAVVTINDSLNKDALAPQKTLGTNTENAFDIFTINKATRTVNITRIGVGSDRKFNY